MKQRSATGSESGQGVNPKRKLAGRLKKKKENEKETEIRRKQEGEWTRAGPGKVYGYRGTINILALTRWRAAETKGLMRERGTGDQVDQVDEVQVRWRGWKNTEDNCWRVCHHDISNFEEQS